MAELQLPDAASTNRTLESLTAGRGHDHRQAVAAEPVHGRAATACSTASPSPTARWSWSALKPFAERKRHEPLGVRGARRAQQGVPADRRRPTSSPSTCRRSWGSAIRRASSSSSQSLAGAPPSELAAGRARPDGRGPARARSSPASSRPTARRRRRSTSRSTASGRRRWASPSPTSSRRCRRRWAATTPTTSTCSAAPGR